MLKKFNLYSLVQTFIAGALVLSTPSALDATTIQLNNDSPFKLKAVIVERTGNVIGNVQLKPGEQKSFEKDQTFSYSNTSTVPWSVIFYCPEGTEYGIKTYVNNGSMVVASGASGNRICKLQEKKESEK